MFLMFYSKPTSFTENGLEYPGGIPKFLDPDMLHPFSREWDNPF
jgi:hypothetical protein